MQCAGLIHPANKKARKQAGRQTKEVKRTRNSLLIQGHDTAKNALVQMLNKIDKEKRITAKTKKNLNI